MQTHIAFIVESAHGHINSTLGIASELVSRDYHVSYAVKDTFAPRVIASGAEAVVYRPLETKLALFREVQRTIKREYLLDSSGLDVGRFKEEFERERCDILSQLEVLYDGIRPDLIIYDSMNPAGRSLASKWGIPAIEHSPMLIAAGGANHDANLVIVSIPRFFQDHIETLDTRFVFVGSSFNGGTFFRPWVPKVTGRPAVLVSATTGLLPQVEFFTTAIRAFHSLPWHIILSIGEELDPTLLAPLPANFEIDQFSSQLQMLEHASLFVGQGGQGSTLESLRCGVPPLLIPPSPAHEMCARRIADLGLGLRLAPADCSPETLRAAAVALLQNQVIRARVGRVQRDLKENNAARRAADLIEAELRKRAASEISGPL